MYLLDIIYFLQHAKIGKEFQRKIFILYLGGDSLKYHIYIV